MATHEESTMATEEKQSLVDFLLKTAQDCRKLWQIQKKLPAFDLQAGEVTEELR